MKTLKVLLAVLIVSGFAMSDAQAQKDKVVTDDNFFLMTMVDLDCVNGSFFMGRLNGEMKTWKRDTKMHAKYYGQVGRSTQYDVEVVVNGFIQDDANGALVMHSVFSASLFDEGELIATGSLEFAHATINSNGWAEGWLNIWPWDWVWECYVPLD